MANHYEIPPWAGKPATGLHLDVLKDEKLIQKLMIDQKKCYLFGRNPQMNDFCIDHASCSRVHAALVYHQHLKRTFLVDLGSTHGTFIGNMRIESHKPTPLPVDSIFHFGASTRMYVIRERPQTANRPILEELEQETELNEKNGGLLGLPESEIELENLTEFNTAHNRRISMLGITVDEETRRLSTGRKRKRFGVSFNEEEDVINPEDIDPSIGRFRNLVQTTVVSPVKKLKQETLPPGTLTTAHPSHLSIGYDRENRDVLYGDLPPDKMGFLSSNILSSKLGLNLVPNAAPDVHFEETVETVPIQEETRVKLATSETASTPAAEPKKKKYAKEAWPGRKPGSGLLV
ncbi:nuclear inhibitor of protein phosphatase 1-like [Artemia franciscana]|uniref:Nuclear inhibitor of protein phosphatase 1 n=1 Tax=Artemia franciscana TaxID=6661 RepID=A0AA88I8F4_ARTSF|nr:hypothetical protein QYM36_001097 [Artemia franciscana]